MPSATLARLLTRDPKAELRVMCVNTAYVGEFEQHKFQGHTGARYLVADLAKLYGAETTVEAIRLRFKCSVCGARDKGVLAEAIIHEPGFSNGGYACTGS